MRRTVKSRKRHRDEPSSNSWFVYLLRCADGSLYTGITKDVKPLPAAQRWNCLTIHSKPPPNQAGLAGGTAKSEFGLEA